MSSFLICFQKITMYINIAMTTDIRAVCGNVQTWKSMFIQVSNWSTAKSYAQTNQDLTSYTT